MGFKKVNSLPLTEECRHYEDIGEVPWDIQKYFHQRYSIFSAYDDDIYLTDDAWFGVTPEVVALQIAKDIGKISDPTKDTLVDLFGGAGGNVIAFALSGRWERIIAVEKDAPTLACAMHNAEVYGVKDQITWVLGDCFDYLHMLKSTTTPPVPIHCDLEINPDTTMLFASPPWGGVCYRDRQIFDLDQMKPYNLDKLYKACHPMEHALYLPRSSDLRQIARLAPKGKQIEVVQYCMRGASKALVAYVPEAEKGVNSSS